MSAVEQYPKLRQSLLSSFDACALAARFDLEYRKFDPEPPHNVREWSSHPQARGSIFHRVAAKCLEEMSAQGEERIETDVAQAILLECLRQHDVEPDEVMPLPMSEVKDLYWVVTKWANDNTFSIADLVSVEERMSATLRYPDPQGGFIERTITGQTDAVFGHGDNAVVIDWKDTWALPGPTDLSFDGYFQQRVYAWLVMKTYPAVQSVTLREFYPRFSEVREATLFRYQMDEIEAELAALVERFDRAVDTDTWKPAPGKHCSYCPRPTACPIFPTARDEGQITSEEEAEKVAAQVIVADAALTKAKKALRAYASEHGPIPVKDAKEPNRVFGFQVTTRTSRPEQEALEAALAAKGAPLTKKEIAALYKTDTQTRFKDHVPQPVIEPDDDIMAKLRESVEHAEARRAGA